MSKAYKSAIQRQTVVEAVKFLVDYSLKEGILISKESLNLICDRYCYVVDPPKNIDEGDNYAGTK